MEKKIIGIDCDEVLCLLMKDFIPYMNERFDLNLKYEDLKEYDLNKYFHLNEEKVRLSIIVIDCSIGRVFQITVLSILNMYDLLFVLIYSWIQ